MSFFALFIIVGWVVLPLLLTEKVLAKNGLNGTKSSISTNLSRYFFNGTKLRKNVELKNSGGKKSRVLQLKTSPRILPIQCACCTTQIYKNLYKNWIFRKFKYERKEEFYATIICFGQFIRPNSRG